MLHTALYVVFFGLILITILPLFPSNHWFFRGWEFPRVQISVLCVVSAATCLFLFPDPLFIVLFIGLVLSLFYHLVWIVPYTGLMDIEVRSSNQHDKGPRLKILTSNVLMPNKSADKLLAHIHTHKPDVVVTLESNQWWQEALEEIHDDYPYRKFRPLENLYGMHLYSRYPLEDFEVVDLIEKDVPSMHGYLCLNENYKVKCHFTHPAPPSPTENVKSTPRDVELLLIAKQVSEQSEDEPTIVAGDLNDVAWSPTTRQFRQKSGLLDPRIGRGMFNTFHADYLFLRWPLDHVFISHHFVLGNIQRLSSIDSDHFPLLTEIVLKN
ncbi:endonuclease/exonuclease/phosphatase family protein [Glaciecola sp. 1036]|uniref:endonuclease/exonuclease/phosphatase family protein n=1 Tax=Alteromonadaceae TaxID=72275 RepID=UPI003D01B1C3